MMEIIKTKVKKIIFGYSNSDEYIEFLRKKGVSIGERTVIYSPHHVQIDLTRPYAITIGTDVQITRGVTILTHGYDWSVLKKKYGVILGSFGEVIIGNNVFIGTESIIMKGVTIGDNVIIGARSLVTRDCVEEGVYIGQPAKRIMSIEEYKEKREKVQFKEASEQVKSYYRLYKKIPPKEELHEFFYLFEDRNQVLNKVLNKKLNLLGNYNESLEVYMNGENQMFFSYKDFISACNLEEE